MLIVVFEQTNPYDLSFVGLEDARVVRWNNQLYICGVRRDVYDNGQGRMELCEIDWTEIFDLDATFATHATTHSEVFTHSKYASLVMKDAIADTFRKKFNKFILYPNIF